MTLSMALMLAFGLQQADPAKAEPAPDPEPEESLLKTMLKRVTLSGQMRLRGEYRDFVSYANAAAAREDDDIYLSRLRVGLDFAVDDDLNVFFQPQDQRTFGDEASVASDETNLDVHQVYVEFRNLAEEPLSIRAGRQELQYGDQRLISPLDWHNVGRAWDGVKVRYAPGDWWIEGFATVVREAVAAEDDHDFVGLYASYTGVADHAFDAYVFGRHFNDDTFTDELGRVGDLRDVTAGIRLKGATPPVDYSLEAITQSGDYVDDDISAHAFAATLGYTFDHPWKPRVGIEYAFASGDGDPADGDHETFDPLYPFGHFYSGFADVFSFKNGHDWVLHLKASPAAGLTVLADVHLFELDEEKDAWYNGGGAVIRRDTTGMADAEVGSEIDLHAKVDAGRGVKFWMGWSRFFAGDYVKDTPGTDRNMDWFFAQMVLNF